MKSKGEIMFDNSLIKGFKEVKRKGWTRTHVIGYYAGATLCRLTEATHVENTKIVLNKGVEIVRELKDDEFATCSVCNKNLRWFREMEKARKDYLVTGQEK